LKRFTFLSFFFLLFLAQSLLAYTVKDIKIIIKDECKLQSMEGYEMWTWGIVETESNCRVIISRYEPSMKDFSIGLMGMTLITAKKECAYTGGWLDLYQPEINIMEGVKYLKILRQRYHGNILKIIQGYHGGHSLNYFIRVARYAMKWK